ncbi:MAG: hypothetical protein K8E24_003195 [Methanobacterium paludis]|nr:hypothetical protein [Methanobacterium paludis]
MVANGEQVTENTEDLYSILNFDSIYKCKITMTPSGILNEKTSSIITIQFYDEKTGNPLVPESVNYSIHDRSGIKLNEIEVPKPVPKIITIELSREDNKILNENTQENRILTLEYAYSNSKGELVQGASVEYIYSIKNLKFVT